MTKPIIKVLFQKLFLMSNAHVLFFILMNETKDYIRNETNENNIFFLNFWKVIDAFLSSSIITHLYIWPKLKTGFRILYLKTNG